MITRDVNELQVVPAFLHAAKFVACGAANLGTCTCAAGVTAAGTTMFPGLVIDRYGLRTNYNAVAIAPNVYGDANVSDENAAVFFQGITVGLQHTSATGGTWVDYSTGAWIGAASAAVGQGLWRQTTATSTGGTKVFSNIAAQQDVGTCAGTLYFGDVLATTTSTAGGVTVQARTTSTGYTYYAGPPAVFDLSGAKRFIRCVLKPTIESTACGSLGLTMSAVAIFGEPGESGAAVDYTQAAGTKNPPWWLPVARILVTTPCAT